MSKKMKVACLIVSFLLLSSCSFGKGVGGMIYSDDGAKANARLEQVLEANETGNRDLLKSLFSEYALQKTTNLDEGIDYLFEFVQGDIKSWKKRGGYSGGPRHYGHNIKSSLYWFYVDTEVEHYLVTIEEYTEYTDEPEKVGVYKLLVTTLEGEDNIFEGLGIYIPEGWTP